MSSPTPSGFFERLLGRVRSPWLTVLLALLLVLDLVVPDPLPFVDEAVLALLTVVAASWRRRDPPDGTEPPLDSAPRE